MTPFNWRCHYQKMIATGALKIHISSMNKLRIPKTEEYGGPLHSVMEPIFFGNTLTAAKKFKCSLLHV